MNFIQILPVGLQKQHLFYGLLSLLILACQAKQESVPQVEVKNENEDKSEEISDGEQKNDNVKYILFFGNSLTAGFGLDESEAFPALIQQRLDSLRLPYTAINAGLSGETSSGGNNRIEWVLRQKVDVFVLELGANDMLRGLNITETESNLRGILDKVKLSNPNVKIIIAGMQAPPNMGADYSRKFAAIYPKLAKDYDAVLIPFLLENVATKSDLNLSDGKHPNAEGQKYVCENVWKALQKVI